MKFNLIGLGIILGMISTSTFATEYIYRDLMANTLSLQHCEAKEKASEDAQKEYKLNIYSKKFCQTQGYGWHVEQVKDKGKLVCNECTTAENKGKYQCHIEDVVVECKRIKPGTVGMLPGKS
jgi:hypothetical protein